MTLYTFPFQFLLRATSLVQSNLERVSSDEHYTALQDGVSIADYSNFGQVTDRFAGAYIDNFRVWAVGKYVNCVGPSVTRRPRMGWISTPLNERKPQVSSGFSSILAVLSGEGGIRTRGGVLPPRRFSKASRHFRIVQDFQQFRETCGSACPSTCPRPRPRPCRRSVGNPA
jgi:hypothetical protein